MTARQTDPWRIEDNAVALAYSCAIILREQRSKLRGNGHGLDNADAYRNLHRARDQRVSPGRVLIRGLVLLASFIYILDPHPASPGSRPGSATLPLRGRDKSSARASAQTASRSR